jgi:hypothetical protein
MGLDNTCLSAQYAQGILDGKTQDAASFQTFFQGLLAARPSGLGDSLLDRVQKNPRIKK